MKKVRYVATMVVEFEVGEDNEKTFYPEGLNLEALKNEMQSDNFHEIFTGELISYEAKGIILENGKAIAEHNEVFD